MYLSRIILPLLLTVLIGGEEIDKKRRTLKDGKLKLCDTTNVKMSATEMPTLTGSFITDIEVASDERGYKNVRVGKEMYDATTKKGVLEYRLAETPAAIGENRFYISTDSLHYDRMNKEYISIYGTSTCSETGDPSCDQAKRCKSLSEFQTGQFLERHFGFKNPNKDDDDVLGAVGMLQWAQRFGAEYTGPTTCRNMVCEKFETCIESDGEHKVYIVYLWSGSDWTMNEENESVPVAIEITSTGPVTGIVSRAMNNRFDFFEFYPDLKPDPVALSPPNDVFCHNRVSTVNPPEAPRVFSYTAEVILGLDYFDVTIDEKKNYRVANTQKELYDWQKKITMVEFKPYIREPNEYRYLQTIRKIDDFNQGVSYFYYPHLDHCNMTTLSNYSTDSVVNEDGSISMQNPSVFENMDEPLQYNGYHWDRGLETETWIGTKRRPNSIFNDTYIYHYSMSYKEDTSNGKSKVEIVPSHLVTIEKFRNHQQQFPHILFNIRDYDDSHPMTHALDVSKCYTKAKHFILDLPENSLDIVQGQLDQLLYSAQGNLAITGQISSLRVNRLAFEVAEDRLLFSLLPLSGIDGNSETAALEKDLDEAIRLIRKEVDEGKFVIIIEIGQEEGNPEPVFAELYAEPDSMVEVDRQGDEYYISSNRQYTSGDMAGLAIGMLLSTMLLTVVGYFGYKHYKGIPNVRILPRLDPRGTGGRSESTASMSLDQDLTA